ncbi:MAG TPA: molybdopterin-dependent oxidoreductase [Gemmatimonadales bacterium]|nr:molybdopterin-dependent oxidoreductase [Gemmatimonadales bacterium]
MSDERMSDESERNGMDRRRFLTVLGATSAGAAALSGCSTQRVEKLIPYLVQSEDQVPGVPTYYASTCTGCAEACGLHVKVREGRAVKLEGNPEHPVNRGRLCSRGQAELQGLYNPGRLAGPMLRQGSEFKPVTWEQALARFAQEVQKAGNRIAVVSGAGRGTFSDLLTDWTTTLGGTVVRYEPFAHEVLREANQRTFGTDALPMHDFARARYILSFGADFLDTWHGSMENQRGYAEAHGFERGRPTAKHVYFAPRMDLTGLNADEWYTIKPGTEAVLALAIANLVAGVRGGAGVAAGLAQYTPEMAERETGVKAAVIRRVAREFAEAQPSLALAGGVAVQHRNALETCAAVNVLNSVAGNIGQTVHLNGDVAASDGYAGLAQLVGALNGGQVGLLVVHEANPVYATPKAAGFAAAMQKAGFRVSTSPYLDETAAASDLLLPNLHGLERWDDANPRAGVYSLMQPTMEPVFQGMHTGDVLLKTAKSVGGPLAKFTAPSFEAHLQRAWGALQGTVGGAQGGGSFDDFWRAALARGGVFTAPKAAATPALAATALTYTKPAFEGDGEFVFLAYPHSMLYDGRGANKPWLLENADPVTKITWHSWIELHPAVAKRLDVRDGEILRLTSPHGTIEAPAYLYAGLHPDVVAVPLGLGHTAYGDFAKDRGVNALDLLGGQPQGTFLPYLATKVKVERTHGYKRLASVEGVPRQLGRGIAEAMPLAAASQGLTLKQALTQEGHAEHEINTETEVEAMLGWRERQVEGIRYGNYAVDNPQWGMTIDLSKCTGCQACVTACYAENNIPWVGEESIYRGREMTWIRIERYWEGGETPDSALEARFIPMPCQHCANAPCEPVCPVYAAYHTPDGLNGQVYNRCVGTRYCANNCPYKVRYFNWSAYNKRAFPEPLNLGLNPDVTVRGRGVMEKCTFCIQRIRYAQNQARVEDRPLMDGDVVTACAQACPSAAIVFGNVKDPASRVHRSKQDPRGYHVLEDINTRPAVTYLAKVHQRAEA